ncbi:VCBS repeat-containing protein [Sulfitobacter mediterraneus]|uniref:VCBS repeat-containing protein n=1 Tax=Sulfitobacter mediterraneus TaxID=83219 RepID=UPI001EEEFAF4|nr:VCBS repeat-containing protein [Sulfitobacter mediterraneus]
MRQWRRSILALLLLTLGQGALADPAPTILAAEYAEPTTRYTHGILGDAVEWGALRLRVKDCADCTPRQILLRLPQHRVFEDVAPRVVELGTGTPLVMVVESDLSQGARLAIYDAAGLVTATPFIGTRNRWLAPIGAADLDGDGTVELAYIDRPHLAKTLRLWRFEDGTLTEVAKRPGLTNHRIGETDIAGGIRTCAGTPEMIVATANWSWLIAVTFDGTQLQSRDIGPHKGRKSFRAALACN